MTRFRPDFRRAFHLLVPAALAAVALAACGSASSHTSAATTSPSAVTATTAPKSATSAPAAPTTTGTPATSAAPPTTAAAAAATGSGNCYEGNWVSTNYTQAVQGQHIAGGAGIHFSITPAQISIDFSGMQPVIITGSISGQGIFLGREQAPASFSPSGTFTLPAQGTSNVTFEAKLGTQASYSAPIKAGGFPTGGISASYTCSAGSLTLTVPTPQGPTTVTLARS
jgi:hypothetical protein